MSSKESAGASSKPRQFATGTKLLDRASLDARFPLHYATLKGDVDRVRYLLGKPAAGGGEGCTSSQGGVGFRRSPNMRADDEDDLGRTALHVAASVGQTEICAILLDVDPSLIHARANGMQGAYPIHLACAGGWESNTFLSDHDFYASLQGTGEEDCEVSAAVNQPLQQPEESEMTESQSRRLAVVTMLLERGAFVTARNYAGTAPIHLAAGCGDVEMAKKLVEYGADINCQNEVGRTPLFSAVSNGQREMVAYLLNMRADATYVTSNGVGVLHVAALCSCTHSDVIDWLVDAGASMHARKSDAKTPLHLASEALLEASIKSLTSEEPYWAEDEEHWPDLDRHNRPHQQKSPALYAPALYLPALSQNP
jgi:ankyrin repeat protein